MGSRGSSGVSRDSVKHTTLKRIPLPSRIPEQCLLTVSDCREYVLPLLLATGAEPEGTDRPETGLLADATWSVDGNIAGSVYRSRPSCMCQAQSSRLSSNMTPVSV